jgi:ribosomal protein S18 acetylase RimI-like enzyme
MSAKLTSQTVVIRRSALGIDWSQVKSLYVISDFDNGRGPEMLRRCFEGSSQVRFAICEKRVVGTARAISDGTSCAAIFDVCVHPNFRRIGIGRRLMKDLVHDLPGQYILLTTTVPDFYEPIGFKKEPTAMSGQVAMNPE